MKDSHLTLRLPRELARALGRWARERGVAKSVLVREAVAGYLVPHPSAPAVPVVSAADAAQQWKRRPRLSPEESAAFEADVAGAVRELRPPRAAWVVILDTSVLVAAERGSLLLEGLLESRGTEPVWLAAITASELLHGVHRERNPGARARRAAFVEASLEVFPVLPFGLAEARRHAALWAELARAGTPIGAHDMLIGATALARGEPLATLNRREFALVPGLHVVTLEPFVR